jgi:hypothetical protein
MQRPSTSEFIFIMILAGRSGEWACTVRSISAMIPSRRWFGAMSTLR